MAMARAGRAQGAAGGMSDLVFGSAFKSAMRKRRWLIAMAMAVPAQFEGQPPEVPMKKP